MSNIAENETHRNQQSLAARSIAKEHRVFARSSLDEDITIERASEDHLRDLAETDALTELANCRRLSETLESEIKRSDRTGRAFAVLIFDLDGMKGVSEKHGPLEGDRALCRLAELFHFSCRSIDTVARYRGGEFAIILPETGAKEADAVGRRICERLSKDREKPSLSVSVGIVVYPEDDTTIETLFQAADLALYKMKGLRKTALSIQGVADLPSRSMSASRAGQHSGGKG